MNRVVLPHRVVRLGTALLIVSVAAACVSSPVLQSVAAPQAPCEVAPSGAPMQWLRATAPNERRDSSKWCAAIGGPIVSVEAEASEATAPLAVVSWNTHVGGGDVEALVADLRAGRLTPQPVHAFVLLLQEVHRAGPPIPGPVPRDSHVASAQTPSPPGGARRDIAESARALGLTLFYVPSMRNGTIQEDRGNAILASAELGRLEAVELPLEHQRRVALLATVRVRGDARREMTLKLVCTHFTNMVPHHLWALSEPARVRQARVLAHLLADGAPTILGGDFNAWFGFHDAAYRELAAVFPQQRPADTRPTFGPMRLDHMLASLPAGWSMEVRRAESRYGSDHYPLIGVVKTR